MTGRQDPTCVERGHAKSWNPRVHTCLRCGQPIPTDNQSQPTRRRDIDSERQITREATSSFLDVSALINHAERRAATLSSEYVNDPMHVRTDRDRLLDVAEELADGRNHLVWWMQDHTDDPRVAQANDALRAIACAYAALIDQ